MTSQAVPSGNVSSNQSAYLLIIAGVVAALHVWKLPPSLPVLQAQIGLTLVQSGFLLSVVQTAGMLLGLVVGLFAERIGLRRCVLVGLSFLSFGSFMAPVFDTQYALLGFRVVEGVGFLMVIMPAPALIRRIVEQSVLSRVLGIWAGYVPMASIIALLGGTLILDLGGWRPLWWFLSLLTAVVAYLVWRWVPPDRSTADSGSGKSAWLSGAEQGASFTALASETLRALNVWMLGLCFALYSAQWMAIVAFMPTIYVEAGYSGAMAAAMTTIIAAGNALGSLLGGRLLHMGWHPHLPINFAFVAMAVCAVAAFAFPVPTGVQVTLILVFSAAGGLIPATVYYLAMTLTPSRRTLSPTMGWIQQCIAIGQFGGPLLVAWVVTISGSWSAAWVIPVACSSVGVFVSTYLGRQFLARQNKV